MRWPVKLFLEGLSARDRKVIVLTFEIFWIAVFVLERAASHGGAEVASFVYANF